MYAKNMRKLIVSGIWAVAFVGILFGLLGWQSGQASAKDGDLIWRGLVEATPAEGQRLGNWTVGGQVFVANGSTEFDESEGALIVGACAKVKYVEDNGSKIAEEIDSEPATDCNGGGGDDGGGDDGGGDDNSNDQKRYARVDAMPTSGLTGEWTIGGVVYAAGSNTYFEQEQGAFSVGACVEVEYVDGTPLQAKEIKTESSYKCDGQGSDDDDNDDSVNFPKGELYGVIRSLPADGLIGQWMIGSIAMTVTEQTQLKAEHGPFEVGVLVEAKFYTNDADENIALKIESKYKTDDNGSDDDNSGSFEGNEGHAFGVIEVMPSGGVSGTWTISGIDYVVDAQTRLDDSSGDDTPLAVGVQVKVEYYVNGAGERVAKEIETSDDDGSPSQVGHFKTYGFVDQKPVNSVYGQWIIDGVTFVADQTTLIDDSSGVLVEGSYVEVEYRVESGVNQLKKIEAHVPPGAGSDDKLGRLESVGQLAASSVTAGSAVWVIDGVSYTVTDATALNNTRGALTIGSTVTVNSYTDASGAQVATLVRGITLDRFLYLPAVIR